MKKVLIVVALLLAYALGEVSPRFEHILSEEHSVEIGHRGMDSTSYMFYINVFHDRVTGDEIACVNSWDGVSCYKTGRNWK